MSQVFIFRFLLLAIAAVCIVGLGWYLYLPDHPSSISFLYEVPRQASFVLPRAYISGSVVKPGVYELYTDMRIEQLVYEAGGFSEDVDADYVASQLNLAELVIDGQHIFIPRTVEDVLGQGEPDQGMNRISINTSSLLELTEIPGVGESTAIKIIENRPYSTVQDIKTVPGIGESKYAQMLEYITI